MSAIGSISTLCSSKGSEQDGPNECLHRSTKCIFYFCRALGLIPFSACQLEDGSDTPRKRRWMYSIYGALVALALFVHCVVAVLDLMDDKFVNAEDYSGKPQMLWFYSTCTFVFVYHQRHHVRLIRIFWGWKKLQLKIPNSDKTLRRDATIIAFVMLSSTIGENAVNHLRFKYTTVSEDFIESFGYDARNETFLRIYYKIVSSPWEKLIPYSLPLALYVYISEKVAWYGWNASDVIMLVLTRAIYVKFKNLYIQGEALTSNSSDPLYNLNPLPWKQIAEDHYALWCLTIEMRKFLSPLIFATISTSTYFICIQIHFGLSGSSNVTVLDSVYAVWSVAHIWMRVFSICYAGSKLNEWAHKVGELLKLCPSEAMGLDVIRTGRLLIWNEIGWTAMDCFMVSKNLLLKILGTVFTFEMVILQATATRQSHGKNLDCFKNNTR